MFLSNFVLFRISGQSKKIIWTKIAKHCGKIISAVATILGIIGTIISIAATGLSKETGM